MHTTTAGFLLPSQSQYARDSELIGHRVMAWVVLFGWWFDLRRALLILVVFGGILSEKLPPFCWPKHYSVLHIWESSVAVSWQC